MEHLGFIQDMMDVKVLILFVAARLKGAATVQELYELAYQMSGSVTLMYAPLYRRWFSPAICSNSPEPVTELQRKGGRMAL